MQRMSCETPWGFWTQALGEAKSIGGTMDDDTAGTPAANGSATPPGGSEPPRRGSVFSRKLSRAVLRLGGWRIVGGLPSEPRFVVVVAPHTSNWDSLVLVLAMFAV